MKLVRFTEKNVDGCGSDAEVILQIDSDEPVNSKILESVISDIVSEYYNTDKAEFYINNKDDQRDGWSDQPDSLILTL